MQSIVAPHGRHTKDQWVNDHLTSLLAAVYCLVAGQLYVIKQGKDLGNRQYAKMRNSILDILGYAQEKVTVHGMDEDELWIGWSEVTSKDIDKVMAEIIRRGWHKDEWFDDFEEMVRRAEPDADMPDEDGDTEDEDTRISERLHVQRADTMFQSRWDMTDKKRQEYREWKDGILKRIEEIERSQATGMETEPTA